MLATLAHTVGWPIPVGGSQAIPDALIADLRAHGGTITAGEEITEPPAGVVLFDTAPTALLSIYRDQLPARYAKSLQRYRFGPGVAKVDFVLSDEIPWTDPRAADAPTLHMGGTREQMAHAEREIAAGRHAEWPMVLAALPHLADPGRVDAQGRRPLWTYAHVPQGSTRRPDRNGDTGFRAFRARFPRHRGRGAFGAGIAVGRPQRQSRRRRHRRRRQHPAARAGRADAATEPVDHADPQGLPVLVGDSTGRRRARHGGFLRRAHRTTPRIRHQRRCRVSPHN